MDRIRPHDLPPSKPRLVFSESPIVFANRTSASEPGPVGLGAVWCFRIDVNVWAELSDWSSSAIVAVACATHRIRFSCLLRRGRADIHLFLLPHFWDFNHASESGGSVLNTQIISSVECHPSVIGWWGKDRVFVVERSAQPYCLLLCPYVVVFAGAFSHQSTIWVLFCALSRWRARRF